MNTGENLVMGVTQKEESVDELIRKLNERGTKVKVVNDDEEDTPVKSSKKVS